MLDRRRNRALQDARKKFSWCERCGLGYDRETDHECPPPIHPDRVQRMRGTCSVRCTECDRWHAATVNRARTVSWYCETSKLTHHGSLRAPGEFERGDILRPVFPPLPRPTPGSARWADGER